jgi:hypothetical protein
MTRVGWDQIAFDDDDFAWDKDPTVYRFIQRVIRAEQSTSPVGRRSEMLRAEQSTSNVGRRTETNRAQPNTPNIGRRLDD